MEGPDQCPEVTNQAIPKSKGAKLNISKKVMRKEVSKRKRPSVGLGLQ